MIKPKDVITMRMPFPNISSTLAVKSHMYICHDQIKYNYSLIKCQTFKNRFYNLNHKIIEANDIKRNPFKHKSLIDCDKLFKISGVIIPEDLLTKNRRNISDDLFLEINRELKTDGYQVELMNKDDVLKVNDKIIAVY